MTTFSLEDLTTPLTRDEVKAKIYQVLGIVGTNTTVWKPGAVMRSFITGGSIILAAFSELQALIARSGFLELSEGPWLTLVARYVYGVERNEASFAEGSVTFTNAGGGIFSFDRDDIIVTNPSTGKQYRNTSTVSIASGATVTAAVRAIEAGAASTSAPNTITAMGTPLLGVTVRNAGAVVGLNAEDDATLRIRCMEKLGALSPMGPWDAYSYAARNAKRADGSRIGVTRVRTVPDGHGAVTTYVATSSGGVTGDYANIATDLGAVNEAIQRNAAPMPITSYVESAIEVVVPVTYRVSMYNTSGMTQAQIAAAIQARLVTYFAGQPIGGNVVGAALGRLYQDALRTVIGSTLPQIFHVELLAPAADVELDLSQVPVLGTVTAATITQVPPSERV